ncbi:MAG: outer membrane beta-barrel protein [Planctomycetota bacterium]
MKISLWALSLSVLFVSLESDLSFGAPYRNDLGEVHVLTGREVGVYLDGKFVGKSNRRDRGLLIRGVAPGVYIIRAVRAGHEPFITTVTVRPCRRTKLRGPKHWKRWPWLRKDEPELRRKRKAGFFFGIHFPLISKAAEQYDNAYVGGGIELGSHVTEMTSISGFVFYAKENKKKNYNDKWVGLNLGPNFHFGPERFRLRLRAGFVLSHVTGDYHDVIYHSLGAGLSGMVGFELKLNRGIRLGIYFGMDMLLAPHEGREYGYEYSPDPFASTWVAHDIESKLSYYGGLYIKFGG